MAVTARRPGDRPRARDRHSVGPFGILGGTYDPIHHAHLAVAEQAREDLGLREVVFVPARVPPHKTGRLTSPAADRLAMVELAIAGNPAFRASRIEIDRPGPSYTIDTLHVLLDAQPAASSPAGLERERAFLIMSIEALAAFPEWRAPAEILDLVRVAVVPRRGYEIPGRAWLEAHFPGRADRFVFLSGPDLGHSASDIRSRAANGRSIRYLVPDAVGAYIRAHGLYDTDGWRHAFPPHDRAPRTADGSTLYPALTTPSPRRSKRT